MRILHKAQRQRILVDLLSENDIMSITDLSVQLNSSVMTIRRDLEYLETKGIVKKMHGAALLVRPETGQPSFYERIEEFDEEKSRIGITAAKMIDSGSIAFFDAGTTPLAIIEHIPDDVKFTAITPGLMTAVALCNKPNVDVIMIGGSVHQSSYSSVNYHAVENIKRFNADIAFISTKAISIPEGAFEAHLPLIEVKRSLVDASTKTVLLADRSKFEARSLCLSISLKDIDLIITDDKLPEKMIEALKEEGKEFQLV